jgi:hypothetical protein
MSRTLLLQFLLNVGTSVPVGVGMDDCTFLGLHTILFDFGGVVVDFGASSFFPHFFLLEWCGNNLWNFFMGFSW